MRDVYDNLFFNDKELDKILKIYKEKDGILKRTNKQHELKERILFKLITKMASELVVLRERTDNIESADNIIQRIQKVKIWIDGRKIALGELASISIIVSDWEKYKDEVFKVKK